MSMTQMHAGAKDHPVTLQTKTTERTPSGGTREVWADSGQVMASRRDAHGDELYEASQKVARRVTKWRIWYRDDISSASWRLRDDYSGEIYDIQSITIMGRRQEQELLTEITDNE